LGNAAVLLMLAGVCLEMKGRTEDAAASGRAAYAEARAARDRARADDLARSTAYDEAKKQAVRAAQDVERRLREELDLERERFSLAERRLTERAASVQVAETDRLLELLRGSLHEWDGRFARKLAELSDTRRSPTAEFRAIQEQADASVFLVHSRYQYEIVTEGKAEIHEGSGFGTGFLLSTDGHLVTNKHVIHPWKFDAELMAMEALGEVRILPSTLRVYAWPTGRPCLQPDGTPLLPTSYNSDSNHNLQISVVASDSLVNKTQKIGSVNLHFKTHALDNHDIIILKLLGGPFVPLKVRRVDDGEHLRKLDSVMALGFPRGHRGLEQSRVESSPSLGTVRKVEDTIHVTASIIPGNSGGPLFNEKGEVVGIATRIYSETLGICIKIDHALDLLARTPK
jgi:S1-C subfamily serine protease